LDDFSDSEKQPALDDSSDSDSEGDVEMGVEGNSNTHNGYANGNG